MDDRIVTPPRGAVLVIDDEPAMGRALGRVLASHDVTLLTSAADALDLLAAGRRFDVILSDLAMPGMSGLLLYDELARRFPDMARRMVFVTGGAFTRAATAFLDRVANECIEKPFDPAAVRALVQRLIG